MLKHLLALSLVVAGSQAFACRMLPLEKNVDKYIYDWIKETPDIYVAEAISENKDDESVSFKVKEVIKGEKAETVVVTGTIGTANTSDFGVHRKEIFWSNVLEGRTGYDASCRFRAEFEIGRTYLLVMKEPFQAKSFELIRNKSDWWYFRVKEILQLKKYRKFVVKREKEKEKKKEEVAEAAKPAETAVAPAATPAVEPAKTESP